jgi:membrane protein DedA with SNARE-associated domain
MDRLLDFLLNFYGPTPYFLILGILLACGLGLPIPEDITLFAAGLLAYYGVTDLATTVVVAFGGVLLGDSIVFLLGAFYGRRLLKHRIVARLLHEERMSKATELFRKHGNKLIFAARFMPGLRAPAFFSAGVLHVPFRVFVFYDGLAALVSVPLIICLVYRFGDPIFRTIQKLEHGIVFLIAGAIAVFVAKYYLTHRKPRGAEGG